MSLFKCSADELAKILAENSKIYNNGVDFFNAISGRGVLEDKIQEGLKIDIDLFNRAFNIATESHWFAFHVYDSWADNQGVKSEGVELYQKISTKMVQKLGVDSDGAACEREAIDMLKSNQVRMIYTLTPPLDKGYLGVNYKDIDDDNDIMIRKRLQDCQLNEFRDAKIEVIILR